MTIQQWDIFEFSAQGPADGNPFVDVRFGAEFRQGHRAVPVEGFYDGGGVYRVRFMPDTPGEWAFVTRSSAPALDGLTGALVCIPAAGHNHGPVVVRNVYHFAYADGAPYRPIGTTCYAWTHQGEALETQTLRTLAGAPFNKLRMCVFPKHYTYNANEPELYPFERTGPALTGWDYARFNPAFFRHLEQRIGQLRDLGIEADVILFHPYDRWGFSNMGREADRRYLRYVVARLAAYRNVWWSFANEYDIMAKPMADWDEYFRLVQACDPAQHLRSIHNWQGLDTHDTRTFYDYGKPWVTHCSIQHGHVNLADHWRTLYRKPVVIDECCYEGDIPNGWGNLTAQDMTRRCWESAARGAYAGHGECYLHPDDVLWWSKGGALHGDSPARIAFLRRVLDEGPLLDPVGEFTNTHIPGAGQPGQYYLVYFGVRQPGEVTLSLPPGGTYHADILDTWAMTITPLETPVANGSRVRLPRLPYVALRLRRTV